MVAIVGSSTLEARCEALAADKITAARTEWGLLIGHPATLSHKKSYALSMLPTPDASDDVDDIIDHAGQVLGMLVGGISIIGLYQYGPEGPTQLEKMRKAAVAVQQALVAIAGASVAGQEWVVLHVPFGARKFLCKSFELRPGSPLKPAEWSCKKLQGKLGAQLAQLST